MPVSNHMSTYEYNTYYIYACLPGNNIIQTHVQEKGSLQWRFYIYNVSTNCIYVYNISKNNYNSRKQRGPFLPRTVETINTYTTKLIIFWN